MGNKQAKLAQLEAEAQATRDRNASAASNKSASDIENYDKTCFEMWTEVENSPNAEILEKAKAGYAALIKDHPDRFRAHVFLGRVLQADGKLDEALKQFQLACKLAPEEFDVWYYAGDCCFCLNKNDESIENYLRAVKIDPNHELAQNNLGCVYNTIAQYDNGIERLLKVTQMNKSNYLAFHNCGWAYFQKDNVPKAIEMYEAALKIKPDYSKCMINLAIALNSLGRPEEALPHIDAIVQTDKTAILAYKIRGRTYQLLDQVAEAIFDFEVVLQFDPTNQDATAALKTLREREASLGKRKSKVFGCFAR